MDEQPQNPVDVIEDISSDVKRGLLEEMQSTLQDLPETTADVELAKQQRLLFTRPKDVDHEEELVLTTHTYTVYSTTFIYSNLSLC